MGGWNRSSLGFGLLPGMMVVFSLVGSVAAAHGIEAALQSCIGSQLWLQVELGAELAQLYPWYLIAHDGNVVSALARSSGKPKVALLISCCMHTLCQC